MNKQNLFLSFFLFFCFANVYADPEFDGIVVFGDSLSDPGNVFAVTGNVSVPPFNVSNIPDAPYARGGMRFSNGPTWIEQLSRELHLRGGTGPALRSPAFTNYAFGGARARSTSGSPFDLTTQVGLYFSSARHGATSNTLFTVYVGGNDVRDAMEVFFGVLFATGDPVAAQLAAEAVLAEAITSIADNIAALSFAGASQFLVPNVPNIGATPAVKALGPTAASVATQLSIGFNAGLSNTLTGLEAVLPIEVTRLDVFGLLDQVVADPQAFHLKNAADACITPGVVVGVFCKKPDKYLFWDGIHPTRAGHALLAEEAEEALEDEEETLEDEDESER